MVGVAGKSKACITCKKRRVKCDLGKPSCLTCLKSNRECSGYRRSLIYINRTADAPLTNALDVLSNARDKEPLPDAPVDNRSAAAELYSLFFDRTNAPQKFRTSAVELIKKYYLPVGLRSVDVVAQGSFSWAATLETLTAPSTVLDASLLAFCLTQLYIAGQEDATLSKCIDWYNGGLQYLRQELQNPNAQYTDETLAAVVVLSTCELFITPEDSGWGTHARGIADIIRLRGLTTSGQTPIWRHLLSRFRVICTLEAITKRRAQLLQGSIWRLNNIDVGGPVGNIDELFQLATDLPAVLELAESLGAETDFERLLDGTSAVMRALLERLRQFDGFMDRLRLKSPPPLFWSVPSVVTSVADPSPSQKLFPFALEFPSMGTCITCQQYWAMAALIYSNIIQLYELVQRRCSYHLTLDDILKHSTSNREEAATTLASLRGGVHPEQNANPLTIEKVREEGTKMARLVCQLMEYTHRTEMGTMAVQSTTFSRWVVRDYFRFHSGHERELEWANNIHRNVGPGTKWDYEMMRFTPSNGPIGSP